MSDANPGDRIARLTLQERAALETRFTEKRSHAPTESIPHLSRDRSPLPLSFAQQRMWFMEQLHPGTALYNVPWAVRLAGPLDIGTLRKSLVSLVERHRILRTTYDAIGGVPCQVVSESTSLPFHVIDLGGASGITREEELRRLLREEAQRPFDLTSDCMLRATVAKLTNLEHVLLLVAHHIAVDGWSCKILNQELRVLYEGISHGREPVLPDLPIQYADYAAWQRDEARNNELDQELEYWRTKLEGLSPTLNLPTSSSQPTDETFSGGKAPIMISNGTAARIRKIASELKITPFMVLASALMVTLYRYTGETDIAIGIPIAGRARLETESLVGLFVNTLVLRGDLSGQPSFSEALQRIKSVCVEAYDHQETPFERIVAELAVERNEDRSPIVQVMLAYWNLPSGPLRLAGMESTAIKVSTETSKFDLSFSLSETAEGLAGTLVYSLRLFNEDRMHDLAAHFVRLLDAGVREPEHPIGTLPMLSPMERRRILVDWNTPKASAPEEMSIHRLFERAASAAPDSTAVVCGAERLTYGELNAQADRLASYLRHYGIHPNELVGISMHRSTDLIVGLMGILKAGGAYLPLDHRFPRDRLRFMMQDAAIRVLLTQSDLEANLPTDGVNVLRLDDDWPEIARLKPVPSPGTTPGDLAYVMYTSGSTGRPKGVMISHRNVLGSLGTYRKLIGPGAGEVRIGTNVTSYAFDVSVDEIFSSVCFGGAVHVVPYETSLDGLCFARYIVDNGINTAWIMPDLLSDVAAAFEALGSLGNLRCLITGLSPKKQRLLQRFRDLSPSLKIFNGYGPTETTVRVSAHEYKTATDLKKDVPIGKVLPSHQIYIVDQHLQPVPIGVRGEILIGGVGVSRGYLNRPDLTAERFIANPFSPELSRLLYRSGDIGRYCDDGTIEFLGRSDGQVKIRGHRIELREIELAIESHPLVKSCHASTSTLAEDDVRLVAYVACTGDKQNIETTLRQYLQERLPGYMFPAAFVFLDAFPLLPSGKIDRHAFPLPKWSRGSSAQQFAPPTSETEKKLARIWEEVLKLDRIGITDNFFELGGHSLLAVRLINQIEEALNVRVPIRILFDHPAIAEVALFIDTTATEQENV